MSLITYLTRVHFADRVLEDALAVELRRLRIFRPVLVIDADAAQGDALDRLTDATPREHAPIARLLVGASAAPGPDATTAAACDGVIGFGGRAALAAARRMSAPGRAGATLPWIAVPTTTAAVGLDAGGETRAAVPSAILCDPTLTLGLDPETTARTAMDALAHCVESYLATAYNPPADGIALEGVRRAGAWAERAVADGSDAKARRELMAAALNAGLAAQKGLGGAEAAACALEAEAGVADRHGMLHGALLPRIVAFNAPAVGSRFAALAAALGLSPGRDLPTGLADLGARLGLPGCLGSLGLTMAALRRAAETAAADPVSRTNPRMADADDFLRLLSSAL